MTINSDMALSIIRSVSDPVFIIVPSHIMSDEDLVRIFQSLEEILSKIEEKTDVKFDILIESAEYFGGYGEMQDIADEQKEDMNDGAV